MEKKTTAAPKTEIQDNTKEFNLKLAERLDLATHAAQMGIWDWDIQKNELVWDDQMYRLYGLKPENFSGAYEAWLNGVHPDDRESSNEASQMAVRGEKEYDTEFRVLWPDGSIHWLKTNGQIFRDQQGNPLRMVGVNYDITARKQAETDLFESKELFSKAFRSSPIAITITDQRNGKYIEVNNAWSSINGFTADEAIGHTPMELSVIDKETRQRLIDELKTKGTLANVELSLKDKTGKYHTILFSSENVDIAGEPCVLSTGIDITGRKHAEARIFQLNRLYSTLSQINQAIVRARDRENLFKEICRVAIDFGKYRMAWIGLVNEATCVIEPFVFAGEDQGYLSNVQIKYLDEELGHGPTGTAIREGRCVICQDIATDPVMEPWREQALKRGYRSSASVPFYKKGHAVGSLTVYAEEPHTFDLESEKLLDEMGMDISFALDTMETEAERVQAKKQVEQQNQRLKILADASQAFAAVGQDYQAVLNQVVHQVTEALADICIIRLISDNGGFLELAAVYSPDPEYSKSLGKMKHYIPDTEAVDAPGLAPHVLRSGEPAFVPLVSVDQLRASIPPEYWSVYEPFAPHSYMIVPLSTQGHNIGIMSLTRYRSEQPSFTEDDLSLAQDLASRAALTINSVHLFDQAQKELADRKQAENELKENNSKLELAMQSANMAWWEMDITSGIVKFDKRKTEMLGYPPENFKHYNDFMALVHPEDSGTAMNAMQRHIDGIADKYEVEYRIVSKSDGYKWFYDIGAIIKRDAKGMPLYIIGLVIDITKRKQAERKIRVQLQRLSALSQIDRVISSSMDMRLSLDILLTKTLSQLNVDAASILLLDIPSQTLEYAAGKGFRNLNIRQSRLQLGVGFAGQVGQERKVLHVPDLNATGSQFQSRDLLKEDDFVEYFGVPLIAKGVLKGVLEIFNRTALDPDLDWLNYLETLGGQAAIAIDSAQLFDSLQHANAELEQRVKLRTYDLQRVNAELEHANRTKDEFLANMSHELRTPLTGILGLTESLQLNTYGQLNEKQSKVLNSVETSGRHLLELINDILDLSKIEAGKFDIYPEMLSIEDICKASLMFVKEQSHKKSILLEYQDTKDAKSVLADSRRLKQILVNLLSNAVKFTPEKGKVTLAVRADSEKGQIHFSVTDTGIGIAKEDLDHLFTPFTQVDSRLNRQYEGTGLGLVLVLRLAEMHGGNVQVETEPGKGSCFTVSLPWQAHITPSIETNQAFIKASADPAPKSHGVLLLVEDNASNVETISDYLQFKGYTLVIASNGIEALTKAEESNPNLILMDIQMPVMDGLEATRRLRADSRFTSTPIIALTALAMTGDRERCIEAGANDYLSKPVSLKELAEKIEKLLQK